MSIMKNINKAKVMVLKDQVSYQEGQIVSKTLELHEGESIVMPAKHPHAVYGKEQYKMLLVVVF